MLKILVVEDHALVREGLLQALKSLEEDVFTLGAQDADSALDILSRDDQVDLILLDLMLPGTSGMALLGVLRKRYPAVPVVILSALDEPDTVTRALRQGAAGFVPKSSSTEVMLDALRQVLAGEVFLPPRLREATSRDGPRGGRSVADRYGLTTAQMRVLELLTQGKTNRQIGEMLGLTEGTVKIHVSHIFKAMNVTNRSQALLLASRQRVKV
ncbi:MAG TPA: response regulator transcription factor [Rhodocyclaceae bacterium]|nr:response regulator transcription factor [Rhodocyclaceae bacterium]